MQGVRIRAWLLISGSSCYTLLSLHKADCAKFVAFFKICLKICLGRPRLAAYNSFHSSPSKKCQFTQLIYTPVGPRVIAKHFLLFQPAKKSAVLVWDSNQLQEDGRRRQIHCPIVACLLTKKQKSKQLFSLVASEWHVIHMSKIFKTFLEGCKMSQTPIIPNR